MRKAILLLTLLLLPAAASAADLSFVETCAAWFRQLSGSGKAVAIPARADPSLAFLRQYPFLFGKPLTLFRANAVRVKDLERLDSYLDPFLNPKNAGLLNEVQRKAILKSYLDDGEEGAKRLLHQHFEEDTRLNGKRVNLLASWWDGKASRMFGRRSPEEIRVISRARVGPETAVLGRWNSGSEVQLFSAPPPEAVDWFLDMDGQLFQITDRKKLAGFLRPEHQKLFGGYAAMSDEEKGRFWDSEMQPRYEELLKRINSSLEAGRDIGLKRVPGNRLAL